MFDNTLTLTVGADPITLTRINQQNYESMYTGISGDGFRRHALRLAHTLPSVAGGGESHLIRLDTQRYDAAGVYVNTVQNWMVSKTVDGPQVKGASHDHMMALAALFGSTNFNRVLDRES